MPVVPKKAAGGPGSPGKRGSKIKSKAGGDGNEAKGLRMGSIISAEDGLYHEPIKRIIKPADQVHVVSRRHLYSCGLHLQPQSNHVYLTLHHMFCISLLYIYIVSIYPSASMYVYLLYIHIHCIDISICIYVRLSSLHM